MNKGIVRLSSARCNRAAHAGLAELYRGLPISRDVPAHEAMPKAKQEAERALQLDESLAEAHTALGLIKMFYEWDWEGSERFAYLIKRLRLPE